MTIISGTGLRVQVIASVTFPNQGIIISQFADDGDPFDVPEMEIASSGMSLNGTRAVWSVANTIDITISVLPNTEEDRNLQILFEANRVGHGKIVANDIITMTGLYNDGSSVTAINGSIMSGMVTNAIASEGRMKTKAYKFNFENITRSQ
jgi:hypothetical protein